jgi:mannosyl-oligosaccharide alpha-1,2-mannosidase
VNSHASDDDRTKPKPASPPTRPETADENAKEQPEWPVHTPPPLPKLPIAVSDNDGQGGQGRVELVDQNPEKPRIRWSKPPVHFPISSTAIIPLPTGKPKAIPKIQFDFQPESVEQKRAREKNLALIKRAFQHAWDGYRKNAMGHDEVRPVSGKARDPFMGWGATLVDSLDTLWIMGLKDEFEEAVEATKKIDFHMSNRTDIPLFETVIRYMGGLIGAYDVSGQKYKVLLDKAVELTEVLMGAFDTPNRMPITYYKWKP